MLIDSIQNGIVIDHITAGKAMELYQILGLDKLSCTVAILKNVTSGKLGRKDIIKIDGEMELDWDLIGYVDPSITVNIIRGGELQEKRTLKLPERIRGVLRCKNPRCITSTERELPQEFVLTDRERRVYRCLYCETEAGK
jgi:aspartate carbamoyltransferase regulatory subunit